MLWPTRFLCPWDSPGKNTGVHLPSPPPGDLPNPGIKPRSPALQADALPSEPPGKLTIKKAECQTIDAFEHTVDAFPTTTGVGEDS